MSVPYQRLVNDLMYIYRREHKILIAVGVLEHIFFFSFEHILLLFA
jgi:hypothetical protein